MSKFNLFFFNIKEYIESKGHKVIELRQAKNWNNVQVIVNEQNVFKCKLNELEFGGDGQLDHLAIEAEQLIQKAYWFIILVIYVFYNEFYFYKLSESRICPIIEKNL